MDFIVAFWGTVFLGRFRGFQRISVVYLLSTTTLPVDWNLMVLLQRRHTAGSKGRDVCYSLSIAVRRPTTVAVFFFGREKELL